MAPVADRVVQADDDGDCDSDEPTAPAADIADIVRLDLLRGARIVESTVLDLRSTALDKGLEAYMESVKPGLEEKACWKALQQLLKLYVSTVQALADVNSIEQLWSMEKRETEAKKELSRDPFICLTKEEEAAVEIAFSSKSDAVLVFDTERDITITGAILHCLKDGEWLNDEVIHIYLKLLKEREMREPQKFLKCHFYDALFHTLLVQEKYNLKVMESWSCAKRLGYCIFDCHMIFVPIHKTNHWALVVVNMKDKKFEYLDSLPRTNKTGWDEEVLDENVMSELSTFFCGVKDEDGKDNDMRYWKKIIVEDLPKQKNGDDCGMFMLKYIDFYCRGLEFCFDQSHMRYFRRRTVKEILNMKAD